MISINVSLDQNLNLILIFDFNLFRFDPCGKIHARPIKCKPKIEEKTPTVSLQVVSWLNKIEFKASSKPIISLFYIVFSNNCVDHFIFSVDKASY